MPDDAACKASQTEYDICRYQIAPTQQRLHYSFSPHERWRFVVLDSFDVSVQGWPVGTPEHESALKLLKSKRSEHVRLPSI
jgi:hypothetical protein